MIHTVTVTAASLIVHVELATATLFINANNISVCTEIGSLWSPKRQLCSSLRNGPDISGKRGALRKCTPTWCSQPCSQYTQELMLRYVARRPRLCHKRRKREIPKIVTMGIW